MRTGDEINQKQWLIHKQIFLHHKGVLGKTVQEKTAATHPLLFRIKQHHITLLPQFLQRKVFFTPNP